MLQTSY